MWLSYYIFTSQSFKWLSNTWWNQSRFLMSLNAGASVFKSNLNKASLPNNPSSSYNSLEFECNFIKLTKGIGNTVNWSLRLAQCSTVSFPLADKIRPICLAYKGEKYSSNSWDGILEMPLSLSRSLISLYRSGS